MGVNHLLVYLWSYNTLSVAQAAHIPSFVWRAGKAPDLYSRCAGL
jgi:serine phosphatase RsbU (regulator of sigma subunit)